MLAEIILNSYRSLEGLGCEETSSMGFRLGEGRDGPNTAGVGLIVCRNLPSILCAQFRQDLQHLVSVTTET